MKIRTVKLVACAAIMALTLSMTACGSDDAAATETVTEVADTADSAEVEPETEEETEPETEEPADDADTEAEEEAEVEEEADTDDADAADAGDYTTLEDYYNDPTVSEALKSAFAAMAGDGMSADCEVSGNEFTVIIKIEDSSMIVDGMGEALSAALDAQADTFKAQVKQFDDVIGQDGACTVVMRYTDPDDNVLAEKAFTAK
ncbi:MAG: DUF4854 domain-containing protein [Lachnospiraceae bacterium]|nr:DUF4854 domain-containing protein [Lachnospiraceae bacterium]